jgi:hypothetical protein
MGRDGSVLLCERRICWLEEGLEGHVIPLLYIRYTHLTGDLMEMVIDGMMEECY